MANNSFNYSIKNYNQGYFKLHNGSYIDYNCFLNNDGSASKIDVLTAKDLTIKNLQFLKDYKYKEILIVGCGSEFIVPPFEIRKYINDIGLNLEWLVTKSSYQTWNILIEEERDIAGLFFL